MDATINGQPVHLGFDTGFGAPFALWRNIAERLGLTWAPVGANGISESGEMEFALTQPVQVECMGRQYAQVRLVVVDMPSYLQSQAQGLVGWPAVKDKIIVLDGAEHTLKWANKVPTESSKWFQMHVLPKHAGALFLAIPDVHGKASSVVAIDTGALCGVALSSKRWREWKAGHPHQPVTLTTYYTPIDGPVVREESWAGEISLDGLILHEVAVTETESAISKAAGSEYAATLGWAGLRRLDLVIDGKAGVAYAHSRTDRPPVYDYNRLGAVFVPENERSDDLVAHVAVGSPADIAGIRNGDLLLRIDQLDIRRWRTQPGIMPISRFWGQPAGTRFVLTLKRGADTIKITAILKNILGQQSLQPTPP